MSASILLRHLHPSCSPAFTATPAASTQLQATLNVRRLDPWRGKLWRRIHGGVPYRAGMSTLGCRLGELRRAQVRGLCVQGRTAKGVAGGVGRSVAYKSSSLVRGMATGGWKEESNTCEGTEGSSVRAKPTLTARIRALTPHENIYTVPNILTFSRLLAAPLIGYLVLHDHHSWAIGLFAYAGITDLVDGWIARRWKLQTVVGTVIDPMADKILMTVLVGCLAWKGAMPVWVAGIILSRDVLLGIAAIYYRYISLPPPKTFARYWDFSLPSAEVHPTGISKINTALQLGLIGWTVGMPLLVGQGFGEWLETGLMGMQYLVATTTIWSGASYLYTKDAVKILTQEEREQRGAK